MPLLIASKNKTKPPDLNNTQNIVNALTKKSKRSFSKNVGSLCRLAANITPSYRSFIYKIITTSSLKILTGKSSCFTNDGEEVSQSGLNKRQKNLIKLNPINIADDLPHELGHAVDTLFGESHLLTDNVILSSGKTFRETFDGELEAVHQKVFEEMMDEYKSILSSKIGKDAFDIIIGNIEDLRWLDSLTYQPGDNSARPMRRLLQDRLYKSGFVETYYELRTNNYFHDLNRKYASVLDALSSKHDLTFLCLAHHQFAYYEYGPETIAAEEFFANLFSAKVTLNQAELDGSAKYFAKSFEAFEELFSIIFNHIEKNKRFTDVKLNKGEKHD